MLPFKVGRGGAEQCGLSISRGKLYFVALWTLTKISASILWNPQLSWPWLGTSSLLRVPAFVGFGTTSLLEPDPTISTPSLKVSWKATIKSRDFRAAKETQSPFYAHIIFDARPGVCFDWMTGFASRSDLTLARHAGQSLCRRTFEWGVRWWTSNLCRWDVLWQFLKKIFKCK